MAGTFQEVFVRSCTSEWFGYYHDLERGFSDMTNSYLMHQSKENNEYLCSITVLI